jgi:F-type H+-transporting ATPase subunit epsilon
MPLSVNIVSPAGVLFRGPAEHVSLMTVEGSMGLYPAHEPILSVLRACSVHVVQEDGEVIDVPIGGGYVSFDEDLVTIAADPSPESDASVEGFTAPSGG